MEDNSVGTVIALNLFEHVRCFWKGFDEVYRVLRPGGAFFVSCPFFLHRHSYPNDYWRFTPDAFAYLLEKYPQKLIGFQGPANKPLQVWAIAFKDPAPIITPELHQKFQTAMRIYAHQPVSKWRRLRYSLGRMICGRSPFATFLDMNNWETTVIGSSEKNIPTSVTTPKANLTQAP
jgi:SAM-dependent methyltransferase